MTGPSRVYPLYRMTWEVLDWVFPPRCAGCDRPGVRWCPDCQADVRPLGEEICPVCGTPQPNQEVCRSCRAHPPCYQGLRSWAGFEGSLRKVLHRLKYRRDLALGQSLADQMLPGLRRLDWPADLVVPVPLGRERQRQRGYNQAALIARPLAMALNLHYAPEALTRPKESRSQVGLNREQRRENVSGAFRAAPALTRGQIVLLIDDVATTGSTLASAAEALLAAGALQVFGFTAARAVSTAAA